MRGIIELTVLCNSNATAQYCCEENVSIYWVTLHHYIIRVTWLLETSVRHDLNPRLIWDEYEHITLLDIDAKEYALRTPPGDPLLTPPNQTVVNTLSLREIPSITQFRATFSDKESRLAGSRDIQNPEIPKQTKTSRMELQNSIFVRPYLGKQVPKNTLRSSRNGFRLLDQFVLSLVNDPRADSQYAELAKIVNSPYTAQLPGVEQTRRSLIGVLLCGRAPQEGVDDAGWKRLRHFLIEFSIRYVSLRKKEEVLPSKMLNYPRGVQRRLSELGFPINFFPGPIFNGPVEGLKSAFDNKFSLQQVRGGIMKSHNVLTIRDIRTIFDSEYLNPNNSTGYRNRLILEFVWELEHDRPSYVFLTSPSSGLRTLMEKL